MKRIYILFRYRGLFRAPIFKIGITGKDSANDRVASIRRAGGVSGRPILDLPVFFARDLEQFLHWLNRSKSKRQKGNGGTEWFALGVLRVLITGLIIVLYNVLQYAVIILAAAYVAAILWY